MKNELGKRDRPRYEWGIRPAMKSKLIGSQGKQLNYALRIEDSLTYWYYGCRNKKPCPS
jgi:hypothetical protein